MSQQSLPLPPTLRLVSDAEAATGPGATRTSSKPAAAGARGSRSSPPRDAVYWRSMKSKGRHGLQFSVKATKAALRTLMGTGVGIDTAQLKALNELADLAISGLNALMTGMVRFLLVPLESLLSLIHLIGKKH